MCVPRADRAVMYVCPPSAGCPAALIYLHWRRPHNAPQTTPWPPLLHTVCAPKPDGCPCVGLFVGGGGGRWNSTAPTCKALFGMRALQNFHRLSPVHPWATRTPSRPCRAAQALTKHQRGVIGHVPARPHPRSQEGSIAARENRLRTFGIGNKPISWQKSKLKYTT